MAEWKELSKTATLRKGYQVFYGKEFGFYIKMQKMHISLPKEQGKGVVPYGCKKGQVMVGLWNPNIGWGLGNSNTANVYIPKNKIKRIRKEIK